MTNKTKLEDILESEYHFKDYKVLSQDDFGKNYAQGMHRLVDPENMEYDVDQAIEEFLKDGYGTIYFYIEEHQDCQVVNLSEYRARKGA